MAHIDTSNHAIRIAIVGSGPSGFYAAEALLNSEPNVQIDMLEQLPTPFGLVRSGVAPDHPKLKQVILVFEKIASMRGFNFIGNVTVGRDISVDELRSSYHAVVMACGAEADRKLGIPGEQLLGSHTATEFVGWYNGHPAYSDREFDLSHEVAVIIGQGNVAVDVARMLSKTVDELKSTDIAEYALAALAESRIRKIYVVGRRGPAQAKFTTKELREFASLDNCAPFVDPSELMLNKESQQELDDIANPVPLKIFTLFEDFSATKAMHKQRICCFQFLRSPVELKGNAKLEKIVFEKNRLSGDAFDQYACGTGQIEELEAGLLFRSIGYLGTKLPGIPFDEKRGIFPNADGRITENGQIVPWLYAAGWIKRGPSGIIGTNRADSVATVAALLEDLKKRKAQESKPGTQALYRLLQQRDVRYISYSDWKKIDQEEVDRGVGRCKPRVKITTIEEMLDIVNKR